MRSIRFAATAAALALAAVQSPVSASGQNAAEAPGFNPHGFKFPAGVYRCELNRSVYVREVSPDMQQAVVNWNKRDYTLRAVNARSGALRYEDAASGLVWLMILDKSMLLDTRQGKQLANECKV
jgi:hypothetical protein